MQIYDVIIVGSGIAGLSAAIFLKEKGLNVVVLTKEDEISETNTDLAQGGIIGKNEADSEECLKNDIISAGYEYNSYEAVEQLAEEGPQLVIDFLVNKIGTNFTTKEDGKFHFTGEAAHSIRRVLHYQDITGEEIENSLNRYAKKIGVEFLSKHTAVDIITNNHHSTDTSELYKRRIVMGIYALENETHEVKTLLSNYVILATGGIGSLYKHTTNSSCSTGDGITMAYRTGADIVNAELIQFHPTAFYHKDIEGFLISESLRGEGARLLDHNYEPFMQKYSDQTDLAPRDLVSRAIYSEMNNAGNKYMYLDIANYYDGSIPLKKRFSQIYETCLKGGIDITKEPIPIVPVAHYFCGGIKVNLNGNTAVQRLYAIGETSCTGVHGANRLASASLLEGLLWAKKSAEDINQNFDSISKKRFKKIPDWKKPKETETFDRILINQDWEAIKLTMWNYAGIIRTSRGLHRAKADLNYYSHRIFKFYRKAVLTKSIVELRNAVVSAGIIIDAAIHDDKSIGCHYIED